MAVNRALSASRGSSTSASSSAGQLGVGDEPGGSGRHQGHGVGRLVIARRARQRDRDGAEADGGQLGDGAGPGPAHGQIGGGVDQVHPVLVADLLVDEAGAVARTVRRPADSVSQSRAPITWRMATPVRGRHIRARAATASLMRRAPSEPPNAATTTASAGRPRSCRALARAAGWRATARTSDRTGFPVSTARGRGVPSNDTAEARATRAAQRLAAPGTAFCSATTIGTRSRAAASTQPALA